MDCQKMTQLSVPLANEPGRLAVVCEALQKHMFEIVALTVVNNVEQGTIRLVVEEASASKLLLEQAGFHVIESRVIVVDLPDHTTSLVKLCHELARFDINIEYVYGYCNFHYHKQNSVVVLKIDDSKHQLANDIIKAIGV